jgi:hypothetical protein
VVATPAQEKFLAALFSNQYRFLAFGGAIRGGKTICALLAVATLCKVFPGSRWAVVRKDLPSIKRNVLPAYGKVRGWFSGFLGPVNRSDWTAPCANGSEIVFFTESIDEDPDLDRWKGLEVNGFVLEEANELAEKSFAKAIERAGAWIIPDDAATGSKRNQPPPLILLTFNPASNWVRHTFYDPWRHGALKAPFYFQPSTVADNPHLPAEYLANLKTLPPQEYKRFVEGDWDAISGRYFSTLNATVHLVPREALPKEIPDWWAAWSGYDWGFRHNAAFGFYVQDGDGNRYCLDTLVMQGLHDAEQAERVAEHAKEIGATRCCQLAYSGGDVFNLQQAHGTALPVKVSEIFALRGIYCVPAYVKRIDGWRALREDLQWKANDDGSVKMPPKLRFVDTPGNRRKLEALLACEPDEGKPEDVKKFDAVEGRGGDDPADELRYAIASRAYVTPPTPHVDHPSLFPRDPGTVLEELAQLHAPDARLWDDLPHGY